MKGAPFKTGADFLTHLRASETVLKRYIPTSAFYRRSLTKRDLAQPVFPPGQIGAAAVWGSGPVRYRRLGRDHLAPLPVRNSPDIWQTAFGPMRMPYDDADVQFRHLGVRQRSLNQGFVSPPTMLVVGRFDPRRLPGFSPLSRVPLETYYPPELEHDLEVTGPVKVLLWAATRTCRTRTWAATCSSRRSSSRP